ncbi:MAG: metal ABC transporter substrate-binding protein [Candidatus Sumerlaeia bacterium]|nr:metal ABC transporter substrate-binding protein [Candidatus Sumerlaeia bacterium]
MRRLLIICIIAALGFIACQKPRSETADASVPSYAVTTSWLECCLRDIAGETPAIVRLCPPGTCPGHFDIAPQTYTRLRTCRAVFLFDFQRSLADKLTASGGATPAIHSIPAPQGLCLPDSYLAGCRAVCDALAAMDADNAAFYEARYQETCGRIRALGSAVQEQIRAANLTGSRIIASGHQAAFCRWLGLDVVAVYSGGEASSPAQIESLLKQGSAANVRFVIANLQEGRQAGEALAWQLKAPLVVFSNFPSMESGQSRFDDLVAANVKALLDSVRNTP